MLDITGVLRVVWMLIGFSAVFHSVAFPEVLRFAVSELSKCRIITTLDVRNLQDVLLKMLSMNNRFNKNRSLSLYCRKQWNLSSVCCASL